jgi:hypothetical protein
VISDIFNAENAIVMTTYRETASETVIVNNGSALAGKFCAGSPKPVFLNVYGAQESIPRNEFRQASLCSLAGRYDNPIPTRYLAPIDCLRIPALRVNPIEELKFF